MRAKRHIEKRNQERKEGLRLAAIADDDRARITAREQSLMRARKLLVDRERELEAESNKMREALLAREAELQEQIAARDTLFRDREKKLIVRQRDSEQRLMEREAEVESLRKRIAEEIAVREQKIEQTLLELQQEKERYNAESRERLERTSKDYVSDALRLLESKERQFQSTSKYWAALGALSLITGLGFFGYVTLTTVVTSTRDVSWEYIAFAITKGVIAIALLAGLARYAYLFSNAYMREALKNADRRHAINFGKFYLESYGAAAEWSEVRDAFANWNTTGSNAFTNTDEAKLDISALEKATSLIESVSKSISKMKPSDKA